MTLISRYCCCDFAAIDCDKAAIAIVSAANGSAKADITILFR